MSDAAAQRQALHTIRELLEAAMMVDEVSGKSVSQASVLAILMECVKYIHASGDKYCTIAEEIQANAQRWHHDVHGREGDNLMTFTDWLAEQAALRQDAVADFAQGPACHPNWPMNARNLEAYEDFVVREYGADAVKTLHRAWNEFQKAKAPKPESSPFGGAVTRSMAQARHSGKRAKSDPPASQAPYQSPSANFWAGHPMLDRAALPMKPPGR